MKACSKCGVVKPLTEFHIMRAAKKDGRRPDCKQCHGASTKFHRNLREARDPEQWRKDRADITLKYKYGISPDDYDTLLARQGGVCAICGADNVRTNRPNAGLRPLLVDHDHSTNEVRGLLCDPCNVGLSRFDDDPERLKKAAQYLEGVMTYQNTGR